MPLDKFKCLNCEKTFEAGDWHCASGEVHRVEPKTYYVRDAPADKRDCKNARLQMLNVIPERQRTVGNDVIVIPGTHIEFIRGQYSTDNPAIQMALDKRRNVFQGEAGKAQWEQDYFSDSEKAALERAKNQAERTRLENQNNALLAEIQKLKGGKPQAVNV